eukprot:maker-scaffold460_size165339-snap-gene-0.26 protein:Tk08597 transcript:maker-scaffold460_size165339-snap-gene-0.26-mRNA-1 annotation:"protein enabled-like"
MGGLAAALQNTKLKKTQPKENSGGSTTSSNSSGYSSMASMMDEMQKTLARRRAKVDKKHDEDDTENGNNGNGGGLSHSSSRGRVFEKGSSPTGSKSNAGSESPKVGGRRRFASNAHEIDVSQFNGDSSNNADLEAMKQEILAEVRKEIKQMKEEIIEVIRTEMSRR